MNIIGIFYGLLGWRIKGQIFVICDKGSFLYPDDKTPPATDFYMIFPSDRRTFDLKRADTVVWLTWGSKMEGFYSGAPSMGERAVCSIKIVDTVTGAIICKRVFNGSAPPPRIYRRYGTSSELVVLGTLPIEEVKNFLSALPMIPAEQGRGKEDMEGEESPTSADEVFKWKKRIVRAASLSGPHCPGDSGITAEP